MRAVPGRHSVGGMTDELIKPNEIAFRVDLTPAEMKIVYTALKTLYDDLGHDEADIEGLVESVLAKLPSADAIRAIDLNLGR